MAYSVGEFGLGAHHRMRTNFPGNNEQLLSLSPRSSETGVLGVNMAEYVLGGAPVVRDRDPRLLTMKGRYVSVPDFFHTTSSLAVMPSVKFVLNCCALRTIHFQWLESETDTMSVLYYI